MNSITFEVGRLYSCASVTFPDFLFHYRVVARTARRVGLVPINSLAPSRIIRVAITIEDGIEACGPRRYENIQAPVLRATDGEDRHVDL